MATQRSNDDTANTMEACFNAIQITWATDGFLGLDYMQKGDIRRFPVWPAMQADNKPINFSHAGPARKYKQIFHVEYDADALCVKVTRTA
jgi:hypothetical protein